MTHVFRFTFRQAFAVTVLAIGLVHFPSNLFGQSPANPGAFKIGIIGAGNIGGTVGTLWVKAGHQLLFSSRHPEELKPFVEGLGALARAGTVHEALGFGEVIFVAVPYRAYPQIGRDYARQLRGKIVLDAGNAVPGRDGDIVKEANANGIGITSAKYLAGARIVRAFNTLSYRVLAREANRPTPRMAIPIAADDKEALAVAQDLVRSAGFDPVIVGGLENAKHFARGGPLYGQQITAVEMEQRLKALR